MIKDLEQSLGYRFHNITLLQNALTHSSYANEYWRDAKRSNERLEFLGDSILGMLVAEHLYRNFPERPEGELSRMRADMVCEKSLAAIADKLALGQHLLLGNGEVHLGGRTRTSILADAVEAIIAASYLDGGMEAAALIVSRFVLNRVPVSGMQNRDYKTALQELVQQKKQQVLQYRLVSETGPDHNKEFTVEVILNGQVVSTGTGSAKKRAEQDAARCAIAALFPGKE